MFSNKLIVNIRANTVSNQQRKPILFRTLLFQENFERLYTLYLRFEPCYQLSCVFQNQLLHGTAAKAKLFQLANNKTFLFMVKRTIHKRYAYINTVFLIVVIYFTKFLFCSLSKQIIVSITTQKIKKISCHYCSWLFMKKFIS